MSWLHLVYTVPALVALVVGRVWGRAQERRATEAQLDAWGRIVDAANDDAREARRALSVALSVAHKGIRRLAEAEARIQDLGMDVGHLAGRIVKLQCQLVQAQSVVIRAVPAIHRQAAERDRAKEVLARAS